MTSIAVVAVVVQWVRACLSADRTPMRPLPAPRVWPIGELPEQTRGLVVGEAQPLERVLRSPLTGRPCLYYVAKIEEYGTLKEETLVSESEGVPFWLVDPSGRAIVDPGEATVSVAAVSSVSGAFDDPTPAEEAFLAKHGCAGKGRLFNKRLLYTEAVIEPGARLEALGMIVRGPELDGPETDAYRRSAQPRLRMTGSALGPLDIRSAPSTAAGA